MRSMFCKRVQSSRLRLPKPSDYNDLHLSLVRSTAEACGKITTAIVDIEHTISQIVNNEVQGYILDEQILVLYDVGKPFYSKYTVVEEVMVLRYATGSSTLQDVCDLLEDIADEHRAKGVVVGGALSYRPRVLARAYRRCGYTEDDNPQLYKWRK